MSARQAAVAAHVVSELQAQLAPLIAAHPGKSGIHALVHGRDAFAERLALIDAASERLDVQYYMWHDDTTGRLLFDALRRAADRGVKVRLLLDDNNTHGMDWLLAALDAHPGIEVRLVNPFGLRWLRLLAFLLDFSRLNRRMHNQSLTADGVATIVGGRNVGDEYFGGSENSGFADLDVLAVGRIVDDVSRSFEEYWRSRGAVPLRRLIAAATHAEIEALGALCDNVRESDAGRMYLRSLAESERVQAQLRGEIDLEWTDADLLVDPPGKLLRRRESRALLGARLQRLLGAARRELDIVSPYFVPMKTGTEFLARLAQSGVRVRVLTNALEATDVPAVHSGYAIRRADLVRAGVQLWELKRGVDVKTVDTRAFGLSGASLHAKTFAVDGAHIFIGSFNMDPRSVALNTELGIIIHSPRLARRLADAFSITAPLGAYEMRLDSRSRLEWVEHSATGEPRVFHHEPNSGLLRRAMVRALQLLPIEWLL